MELQDRLISLRKAQGLNQEALAEKLGVTRQAVSKWERGLAAPVGENLIALSKLFGVPVENLVRSSPQAAAQEKFTQPPGQDAEQEEQTGRPEQAEPEAVPENSQEVRILRKKRILRWLAAAGAGVGLLVLGIYIGIILSRKNSHGSFPEGILPLEDGYTVNIHTEDGDFYRFKKYGDGEIIWQDEIEPEEIDSSTIEDAPDALVIIED